MIKISLLAFLILWHKIEKGGHFLAGAILPRFQGSYLPHFNVKIMTYHTCSPLPKNLVISRTNWNLDCTLEICDKYEFTYALSNDAIFKTRYHRLAHKSSSNFFHEGKARAVDSFSFLRRKRARKRGQVPEPEMRSEGLWESLSLALPRNIQP